MNKQDRIEQWRSRRQEKARQARQERTERLDATEEADARPDPEDTESSEPTAGSQAFRPGGDAPEGAIDDHSGESPSEPAPAQARESAFLSGGFRSLQRAYDMAQERRALIGRERRLRYLAVIGVPLLVFTIYTLFIMHPLYESRTVFLVRTIEDSQSQQPPMLGLGGGSGSVSEEYQIREYLQSRPTMIMMEERAGYLAHLQEVSDFIFDDDGILGLSDPVDFYRRNVKVDVNIQEGLATLRVRAGSKEASVRYAEELLKAAREELERVASQLNADQLAALEREVDLARSAVSEAGSEFGRVQEAREEFSAIEAGAGIYQIITSLELRLAEIRSQRDSLLANGLTESPLLPRLEAQIATLSEQIDAQRQRLVGRSNSVQRSARLLEQARTRKQLAEATLTAATETLEQARLTALKQRNYLITVAPPSAPDHANVWRWARELAYIVLLIAAVLTAIVLFNLVQRRREAEAMSRENM